MKKQPERYMQPFNKIHSGLDISLALKELQDNCHLFGELEHRGQPGSPHAQMKDIWLRYGDTTQLIETGDYSILGGEHDSVWLKDLPHCKRLCYEVMSMVDGERLGGVLITKLPPGGAILPHSDDGWHANYYDKYYIPIQNGPGAIFGFDDGIIDPDCGDVWGFNNSYTHWVKNNAKTDRIAMIVCIKQNKYSEEGLCLGQRQQ